MSDTWSPEEIESIVDNIGPDPTIKPAPSERRGQKGYCSQCGHVTPREYCGPKCEREAAYALMGPALKFHK